MAKYIVVRSDSERAIVVIGKTCSKDEARTILRNDFKKWLIKKANVSSDASFEEIYAEYEDVECGLSEDSAWLNECHHTDFDWVIIDTETEDVLSTPLSMKQMVLATSNESNYVQGNVLVELDEVIGYVLGEFIDLISKKLVGNPCLMDVNYKLIDATEDGRMVLRVSGDVSEILKLDDEMFEELKSALFMNGNEALEDFADIDLSNYDDKDTIDNILDEVAEQMSDEEQIRYYRKYLC